MAFVWLYQKEVLVITEHLGLIRLPLTSLGAERAFSRNKPQEESVVWLIWISLLAA